jgi:hypothetical protein
VRAEGIFVRGIIFVTGRIRSPKRNFVAAAAAAGNGLSPVTSVFTTFTWPSATIGLQEFVGRKTVIAIGFRKFLPCERKDDNILEI